MTVGALVVVRLESTRMVGARGEIHIVVAGAASRAARLRQERRGLRCLCGLAMANFATLGAGRIDYVRKIADPAAETGDLVGNTRCGVSANHAWQARSQVD